MHRARSLPNPMVMAGAVIQRVKRARIALLGSNIPIQNPVRVAEEFAMLDTLSGGRVVAGMLRGTSNEYVTYGVNPADLLLVYDAAHAIDGDRPEAFAAAVADFLERHEKFVVRRDSGLLYP
jgi:alkanesulfonate monooxygenase SsuD/methylene tetrahydromethanopterin reductase-like flavin-dependent oxidoreductase (luciferase family)